MKSTPFQSWSTGLNRGQIRFQADFNYDDSQIREIERKNQLHAYIGTFFDAKRQRRKKNEFIKWKRNDKGGNIAIRYFSKTLQPEESKSCVSMIYIFIVGAIIFERRVGSEFGLERIFVFYRSIISGYSRGMDGLRHACAYRDESLQARTNIEKHGGRTKGGRYFKAWLRASITNTRRSYYLGDSSRRGEIVSFVFCTGGPELIEPDINPPFVYSRHENARALLFDIYQESR